MIPTSTQSIGIQFPPIFMPAGVPILFGVALSKSLKETGSPTESSWSASIPPRWRASGGKVRGTPN